MIKVSYFWFQSWRLLHAGSNYQQKYDSVTEMSCRLLRCGTKVDRRPLPPNHGIRVTTVLGQGTTAHRPSAIRDFLRTLRFNVLLLFSFLQEKNWTETLSIWSFTQEMKSKLLIQQRKTERGGGLQRICQKKKWQSWWTSSQRVQLCKTGQRTVDFHAQKKAKLCRLYLLSCSWCQVLACTAGHWHVLFNPRTALAQSPAAAPSSELPRLARATHRAPGGHFRKNTTMSYRPLNGHYLIKNLVLYPSVLKVWVGSKTFSIDH